MSFYVCNPVELVSLPYSYFLCSDTSTGLRSQEVIEPFQGLQPTDVCTKPEKPEVQEMFDVFTKLVAGTEEGKMCSVKYTVYQTWLSVCMCSCFYVIGVGYKPMCELFEHLFEGDCFPSIIHYIQICHRAEGTYVHELLYC